MNDCDICDGDLNVCGHVLTCTRCDAVFCEEPIRGYVCPECVMQGIIDAREARIEQEREYGEGRGV